MLVNPVKARMQAGGGAFGLNVRMGRVEAIRRGAQFVTTQTDIAFLIAAANQWTQGVRAALAASP